MEALGALFGNTADACFAVDRRQRIVYWNPAARDLFGLGEAEALGQHCYQLMAGRDPDGYVSCRRQCLVMQEVRDGHLVPSQDIVVHNHRNPLRVNVSTVVIPNGGQRSAPWLVHYLRPVDEAASRSSPCAGGSGRRPDILTRREREVLTLLAQGATTETVAAHLCISTTTARNHVQHILSKLAAHSRLEAVLTALEHRLLTPF